MKFDYKLALKILISAGLLTYLIVSQDVDSILSALSKYNFLFLFSALFLLLCGTWVSALRWREILKTSEIDVPAKDLFVLYVKGYFYNNFLPTQMGGDLYKALSLGRKINNNSVAIFSVFMDRFGGLVLLLLMSLFGISTFYGSNGLIIASILFIFGAVIYIPSINLANKILGNKLKIIKSFKEANDLFIKNKKNAGMVLLYSLVIQMLSFVTIYLIFRGLDIHLAVIDLFRYIPVSSLATLIPSFNGLGTQETVYALLFAGAGVTAEISIAASIMVHVMRLIMSLFGGILILVGKSY